MISPAASGLFSLVPALLLMLILAIILIYATFFWKVNCVRDYATGSEKHGRRKSRKIGELPPVYPNGWFGLLDSRELDRGQVEHVAALGENFAVFRTESGIVRIVDAYCPHLGANMAEGGKVQGEELECQFHSWKFCGATGKCTDIPYSKNVPASIKTRVWDSYEANGVIFVWYHAESAPPHWYPRQIKEMSDATWKYHGRNEFYVNCHIQEIPENGADVAHLRVVHKPLTFFSKLFSKLCHHAWSATWCAELSRPRKSRLYSYDNTNLQSSDESHMATSFLRQDLAILDKYLIFKTNVEAHQIGPGYVELIIQSALGPVCVIQTVTPIQPLLQRVTHLIYAPTLLSLYAKFMVYVETAMFERDVEIWNHKKYVENPILVSEDKAIKGYRRWYKQFYSENSPTYEACRDRTLEW